MGAGAASAQFPLFSPRAGNTTDDGGAMPTSSRSAPPQPTAAAGRNRQVRQRIFDRAGSVVDGKAGMSRRERKKTVDIDPVTRSMLEEAFSGLYFLQGADDDKSKMDMVIDSMDKEEFSKDDLLITEGESGNKLYVVEDGELEVTINGEVIRHMGKGTMLGELALLYDAPRTATVRCMTKCTVWSLGRQVFKQIQAASASDVDVQRARWLINSPELAVLSAIDLSRLVGVMKVVHFSAGDQLYKENQLTNQCLLIEKGNAKVFVSIEPGGMAIEEVDNILGLTRPAGTGEKVGGSSEGLQGPSGFFACDLFSGCLVGIGILRGKAQMADCWRWVGVAELEKAGRRGDAEGADPPCTIIAQTDMQCLSFTVDVFENLFGPISKVLQPKTSLKSTTSPAGRQPKTQERKFDSTKFKLKYVLGSGSFGIVTLAEYRDGSGPAETFALKSLSKVAVIETGQLRHVLDERKLLSLMSNKFIMRLFGTYQTPHQLVMVSEPLNCGDLWCVIYETMPYSENQGLSIALAKVYVAILVLGLAHIHEKGIVYRDLKPENIMLDEKGYLRIIDFGFAKRVPYTKVDSRGELRVHAKTYTLCGTPEYLSPELIFNLGHDQSSDLWALGVLVHEMIMAVTPFAPKRPDNVTELFTNIAMVKKNGLKLSAKLDQKSGTSQVNSLIALLLKAEPSERIGVMSGSTRAILDHPFFDAVDLVALNNGSLEPEHIPEPTDYHEPISNLTSIKPYNGDQSLFAEF